MPVEQPEILGTEENPPTLETPQVKKESPLFWYAVGSPYGKELKVLALIQARTKVETFIPLKRVEKVVGVKILKRKVDYQPAIRNLFFVRAPESKMRSLKKEFNSLLQFKVKPTENGKRAIVVPDRQMEDFIFLYQNVEEDKREIFSPEDIDLRPDARVMIKDGPFEGRVGYYQQVRSKKQKGGVRQKRFVVKVDSIIACAAVIAECQFVSMPEEEELRINN